MEDTMRFSWGLLWKDCSCILSGIFVLGIPVLAVNGLSLHGLAGCCFLIMLFLIAVLDYRYGYIFDCFTYPFWGTGMMLSLLPVQVGVFDAFIGSILGGGFFYMVYCMSHGGMGGGDVKFAAAIGAWMGWELLSVAVLLAFFLATMVAFYLFSVGDKRQYLPFSPFLSVGSYISYFWGDQIYLAVWSI